MNRKNFIDKLKDLYYRDKNCLEELLTAYDEKDKEIGRLNKLISQREKKWEKWTTEKTILSTKMSDYLCKYQNIKREYTKQIKISTDRKKEIERLNNIINKLNYDIKELDDMFYETFRISQNGYYSISEWELKDFTNKLHELKGVDKE